MIAPFYDIIENLFIENISVWCIIFLILFQEEKL